jgi:hypothetical protein
LLATVQSFGCFRNGSAFVGPKDDQNANDQTSTLLSFTLCLAQIAFLAALELDFVLVNVPCYGVPP